jgi:thiamine-monophosphate kinase
MRITGLGEDALIRKLREKFSESPALLSIGDDAAVVDVPAGHSIVYCSDLLAENTHFLRNRHPADSLGYKAVAVNVSDVGAMGAIPMFFTLSVALPDDLEVAWLDGFLDGVAQAGRDFEVSLVGGDSSSADRIFIDVSMVGRVRTGCEVRRSGAQVGDRIYVTGSLGGSALGLERLMVGDANHPAVRRHLFPSPRYIVGHSVAPKAHAMIDISDGLSTDLAHIVEESRVSARIDKARIPVFNGASEAQVLHGGEEYELLIVAPDLPDQIENVPVRCIGEIVAPGPECRVFIRSSSGETLLHPQGYQHFSQ